MCDRIVFTGATGSRVIRVSWSPVNSVLRPDHQSESGYLFPELADSWNQDYNYSVISSIWLPDGRRYRLQYDRYSEVAQVDLPTGGVIQYDYAAGVEGGHPSGQLGEQFRLP